MQPTIEQDRILKAKGKIVTINARAGTGKTATLLMIAESNLDKKILYLVYNSRNRIKAKEIFPKNVHIHTIHSFALSTFGGQFDGFETIRPSSYLGFFDAQKETLSTLTQMYLTYYLNSSHTKLADALNPFKQYLTEEQRFLFGQYSTPIYEASMASLTDWYRNKKNCPHDFYLKLSHIEKKFQRKIGTYELVLVDEGQDLSPIMMDILSTFKNRLFLVGDSHQQIYGFRYAEDAMIKFAHDELYDLTMSFRFGAPIAQLATHFIRCGKEEPGFKIFGHQDKTSHVYFYESIGSIKPSRNTAILCRTNFSLFKNAMDLRAKKQKFRFERNISSDLNRTLDIYWLSEDKSEKIKDDLIRSFYSLKDLEVYAKGMDDFQLLKMIELVSTYKLKFPGIIHELLKLCKEGNESEGIYPTILSTIHASKGQEYESVIIDEDVISKIDGQARENNYNLEEINIIYVGITRAIRDLYLPIALKSLFGEEWQKYTSKFPIIQDAHIRKESGKASHSKSKGEEYYSKQTKRNNIPQIIKVGDKVWCRDGFGLVLRINGEQYLIDLEKGNGHVWHQHGALLKVQILPPAEYARKTRKTSYRH